MILCLTLLTLQTPAARAAPVARVDWPVFLARHDLVWDRLPTRWGESAFIGNGRLGATIDAPGGVLGWTINRTDFVHDQSRFPIGRVVVKTTGTVQRGDARLTLWDAEASGTVTTDRGEVRWRSFTTAQPSVIVIVLEGRGGERGGDVDLDWAPAEARPPRKVARKEAFAPEDLHPPPTVTRSPTGLTSVQTFIGGGAHAESIRRTSGGVFYISIGQGRTDREALAEARAATSEAARLGVARLTAAHRAWWHAFYPASFVSFPDPRLEAYYWIQIYKLGSAMRPDGPILDLAGPWYSSTPWPAIWWNLNIQLTYSPLFRANRLDLAESLFRNLDQSRQALIDNVPARLRGDRSQLGSRPGAASRPGNGTERRRARGGGPAVDDVLLLAPLPLSDGRPDATRARLSAAQAGDRELPRVRRARRRRALASAAHALTRAGHGAGCELRSGLVALGSRDVDRQRRAPRARRTAAV